MTHEANTKKRETIKRLLYRFKTEWVQKPNIKNPINKSAKFPLAGLRIPNNRKTATRKKFGDIFKEHNTASQPL